LYSTRYRLDSVRLGMSSRLVLTFVLRPENLKYWKFTPSTASALYLPSSVEKYRSRLVSALRLADSTVRLVCTR